MIAGCYEMKEGAEKLRSYCSLGGINVVRLDLLDDESIAGVRRLVEEVAGDRGLYCLVNNAAVLVFAEAAWQTDKQVLEFGNAANFTSADFPSKGPTRLGCIQRQSQKIQTISDIFLY